MRRLVTRESRTQGLLKLAFIGCLVHANTSLAAPAAPSPARAGEIYQGTQKSLKAEPPPPGTFPIELGALSNITLPSSTSRTLDLSWKPTTGTGSAVSSTEDLNRKISDLFNDAARPWGGVNIRLTSTLRWNPSSSTRPVAPSEAGRSAEAPSPNRVATVEFYRRTILPMLPKVRSIEKLTFLSPSFLKEFALWRYDRADSYLPKGAANQSEPEGLSDSQRDLPLNERSLVWIRSPVTKRIRQDTESSLMRELIGTSLTENDLFEGRVPFAIQGTSLSTEKEVNQITCKTPLQMGDEKDGCYSIPIFKDSSTDELGNRDENQEPSLGDPAGIQAVARSAYRVDYLNSSPTAKPVHVVTYMDSQSLLTAYRFEYGMDGKLQRAAIHTLCTAISRDKKIRIPLPIAVFTLDLASSVKTFLANSNVKICPKETEEFKSVVLDSNISDTRGKAAPKEVEPSDVND